MKYFFLTVPHNDLHGESGEITSPLYPHLFTTRGEYTWKIYAPYYKYVSIQVLEMSIELDAIEDVCYSSLVVSFNLLPKSGKVL